MEKDWQNVLDRFTYGIYLVSVAADGMYNGMIASWVTQCSFEPPMVMVAIRKDRLSGEQIMAAGSFTLGVLPKGMLPQLGRFKIKDWRRKFEGMDYELSPGGAPVLKDAVGYLDCRVERTLEAGDHALFLARVVSGGIIKDAPVLTTLDYPGRYRGDK